MSDMYNYNRVRPTGSRWQDWVNLILAIWLFISPWALGFAAGAEHTFGPAWNAWVVAIVIGVFSIAALSAPRPWEEWINIIAGAWLFVSPWVLHYTATTAALWNSLIVGAVVFILAIWDLNTMPHPAMPRT